MHNTNSAPAKIPGQRKTSITEGMPPHVHISYQITIVANLMAFGNSSSNIKKYGLNIGQWRIIGSIGQMGPMTARQIVETVKQDKANTSRAIADLEKRALICKLPNKYHAKSPYIWLTKEGDILYKRIKPVFNAQAKSFTSVLTKEEMKSMCNMLDRMKVHIEKTREEMGID